MSNHIAALQQASNDLSGLNTALEGLLQPGQLTRENIQHVRAARARAQGSLDEASDKLKAFNAELEARMSALNQRIAGLPRGL